MEEFDNTPLGKFKYQLEEEEKLFNIDRKTLKRMYENHQEFEQEHIDQEDEDDFGDQEEDEEDEEYEVSIRNLSLRDMVQLERFERWAKTNLFVLSGAAIAIASAITALVLVIRSSREVFTRSD